MKRLSAILLAGIIGLWPCLASAAVELDACTTQEDSGGTSHTVNHTIGTCANCLLTVQIGTINSADDVSAVAWNTTESLTLVSNNDDDTHPEAWIYRLVAPTTGAHALTFTTASAAQIAVSVCSWKNVDQTTPVGTPGTNNDTAPDTGSSITLTVPAGGLAIDVLASSNCDLAAATPTLGADQTQLFNQQVDDSVPTCRGHVMISYGTASPMDWTWSSGFFEFAHSAVAINPVTATRRPIAQIIFQ